jgi:hypothetical protein
MITIDCHPADAADITAYAAYLAERRFLALAIRAGRKQKSIPKEGELAHRA